MLRSGYQIECGICHRPLRLDSQIQIDHVIRLRDGGSHELNNLRPVHQRCNSKDK